MWEEPIALWERLSLGREEYLQRLVTTLILDGIAPPWNAPRSPGAAGSRFLTLLDEIAFGLLGDASPPDAPVCFVDEYLLPKLEDDARNGWPDWAVLWDDRVWVIELKTEATSHRPAQLPYYLRLAAAAHPQRTVDLTYITGPLTKPPPALAEGQRYSHLVWDQVIPLITEVWRQDPRPEVIRYVEMVCTVVRDASRLTPAEQRAAVLGLRTVDTSEPKTDSSEDAATRGVVASARDSAISSEPSHLLDCARSTAADGRQRGVGVHAPEDLERLRDQALDEIRGTPPEDVIRFVLPWLWDASRTGGRALTPEGEAFGYELRFSRYKTVQVTV